MVTVETIRTRRNSKVFLPLRPFLARADKATILQEAADIHDYYVHNTLHGFDHQADKDKIYRDFLVYISHYKN